MVRLFFAAAMVMVAFSSNPFMRKEPENGGNLQRVVKPENPASRIVAPRYGTHPVSLHGNGVRAHGRNGGHINFEAVGM